MKKVRIFLITFMFALVVPLLCKELIFSDSLPKYTIKNRRIDYRESNNKPAKPTFNNLPNQNNNGYVSIACESKNTHVRGIAFTTGRSWISFGDVVLNDGHLSDVSVDEYPWMSEVIIDKERFLNIFNSSYGNHYLINPSQANKIYLFSDGSRWYSYTSDYPVTITATESSAVKYAIIHEYYNDGIKEGEIKETITSSIGTKIYSGSITKKSQFNGRKYEYVSSSSSSFTLTSDESKNILRLKYEKSNETSYRIERKYYLYGEKVATVTGGNKIGQIGDIIDVEELIDLNPSWKYYTIDEVRHEFVLESISDEKIILDESLNSNIITLIFKSPLEISITADHDKNYVDEEFRYTIDLTNDSLSDSIVNIKVILDDKLNFISAAENATFDSLNRTLSWSDVIIPASGKKSLSILVLPNWSGEVISKVIMESEGWSVQKDSKIEIIEENVGILFPDSQDKEDLENDTSKIKDKNLINIPNTGKTSNKLIIIFGFLFTLLGFSFIVYGIKRKVIQKKN